VQTADQACGLGAHRNKTVQLCEQACLDSRLHAVNAQVQVHILHRLQIVGELLGTLWREREGDRSSIHPYDIFPHWPDHLGASLQLQTESPVTKVVRAKLRTSCSNVLVQKCHRQRLRIIISVASC